MSSKNLAVIMNSLTLLVLLFLISLTSTLETTSSSKPSSKPSSSHANLQDPRNSPTSATTLIKTTSAETRNESLLDSLADADSRSMDEPLNTDVFCKVGTLCKFAAPKKLVNSNATFVHIGTGTSIWMSSDAENHSHGIPMRPGLFLQKWVMESEDGNALEELFIVNVTTYPEPNHLIEVFLLGPPKTEFDSVPEAAYHFLSQFSKVFGIEMEKVSIYSTKAIGERTLVSVFFNKLPVDVCPVEELERMRDLIINKKSGRANNFFLKTMDQAFHVRSAKISLMGSCSTTTSSTQIPTTKFIGNKQRKPAILSTVGPISSGTTFMTKMNPTTSTNPTTPIFNATLPIEENHNPAAELGKHFVYLSLIVVFVLFACCFVYIVNCISRDQPVQEDQVRLVDVERLVVHTEGLEMTEF